MDTIQVIRGAGEKGMSGVSIDLSDAYYHIRVAERNTHFLAFQVGFQKYKYVVCPYRSQPHSTGFYGSSYSTEAIRSETVACASFLIY